MLLDGIKSLSKKLIKKDTSYYEQLKSMVGKMVVRHGEYDIENLGMDMYSDKPALLIEVDPINGIKLDTKDEFKIYFDLDSIVTLPASYIDGNWSVIQGGDITTAA